MREGENIDAGVLDLLFCRWICRVKKGRVDAS
jgi:hypothetical protein